MTPPISKLFFLDSTPRPLGQFTQAGRILSSSGIGGTEMRVLGDYAFVLLLHGTGTYRDARGARRRVQGGDLITLFPELAHSYGPGPGETWDEIYLCFRGPLFDLWRQDGLLNSEMPVRTLPDARAAETQLDSFCRENRPQDLPAHMIQLGHFSAMASALVAPEKVMSHQEKWVAQACGALRTNLERHVNLEKLAQECGLSYESFRKSFRRSTGFSPAQYRLQQRIRASQALLKRGDLTHAVLARTLGFRDEAHFSRRFKEVVGMAPRAWKLGDLPLLDLEGHGETAEVHSTTTRDRAKN